MPPTSKTYTIGGELVHVVPQQVGPTRVILDDETGHYGANAPFRHLEEIDIRHVAGPPVMVSASWPGAPAHFAQLLAAGGRLRMEWAAGGVPIPPGAEILLTNSPPGGGSSSSGPGPSAEVRIVVTGRAATT